jgi:hypothetical protein
MYFLVISQYFEGHDTCTQFIYSNRDVYIALHSAIAIPTGKLISSWAQVDPNELIWSQTFLCDQVGDNLIPNIHDI